MSLNWLSAPNTNYVLTTDEIHNIIHVKLLCGLDFDIGRARRDNIEQYSDCQETRKWCGLCKYDSPDRVTKIFNQLRACKKEWDQKMIQMYRAKTMIKEDQTNNIKIVTIIKKMHLLLLDYRDLIGICRSRDTENIKLKKEWNGCKVMELLKQSSLKQCIQDLMNGYIKQNSTKLQYSIYPFVLQQISIKYLGTEDLFIGHKCLK